MAQVVVLLESDWGGEGTGRQADPKDSGKGERAELFSQA